MLSTRRRPPLELGQRAHLEAWSAAADLSAQLNIVSLPHAYHRVLSMPATIYDDLWTAAKAMYKTEPIIADGGEVIIYAPHITEISYSHRRLIDELDYDVRDYFLKQWERFKHSPGGFLGQSPWVSRAKHECFAIPGGRPATRRRPFCDL